MNTYTTHIELRGPWGYKEREVAILYDYQPRERAVTIVDAFFRSSGNQPRGCLSQIDREAIRLEIIEHEAGKRAECAREERA